jgi:diguanylate cyclase (GGDEF)-like protein
VARYGGEEFLLVLPGASADSAMRTASRLRDLVNEERIPHETSLAEKYITVSQGVITVQPDGELQPVGLVKRVDDALYRAKDSGRNTIAVA